MLSGTSVLGPLPYVADACPDGGPTNAQVGAPASRSAVAAVLLDGLAALQAPATVGRSDVGLADADDYTLPLQLAEESNAGLARATDTAQLRSACRRSVVHGVRRHVDHP